MRTNAVRPKNKRWTFAVPEDATLSKVNKRVLEQALDLLGPFPRETEAEAERLGHTKKWLENDLPVCREAARKNVMGAADVYRQERYLAKNAPRLKHILQSFDILQQAALKLSGTLEKLDDMTRLELMKAGINGSDGEQHYADPVREMFEVCLPKPSKMFTDLAAEGTLVDQLRAIAQLAEQTRKNVRDRYAKGEVADKGGRTNFYVMNAGEPKRNFVLHCYDLFEFFRPGEATSTDGGQFFHFVELVHQLATGETHETKAKVAHWLPIVVGRSRKKEKQRAELKELFDRLRSMPSNHPEFADLMQREHELLEEFSTIDKKLFPQYARAAEILTEEESPE